MEALNPRPDSVTTETRGGLLVITIRWYSLAVWLLLAFCVIWDAFVLFFFFTTLKNLPVGSVIFWAPLLHVGVGIVLSYIALAHVINRTVISVGNGRFVAKIGPLPWPGGKDLSTADFAQLFCDEVTSQNRNGGRSSSFRLNAVTKDGRKLLLVRGLQRDQALYAELVAEKQLGIVPAPVVGEVR